MSTGGMVCKISDRTCQISEQRAYGDRKPNDRLAMKLSVSVTRHSRDSLQYVLRPWFDF